MDQFWASLELFGWQDQIRGPAGTGTITSGGLTIRRQTGNPGAATTDCTVPFPILLPEVPVMPVWANQWGVDENDRYRESKGRLWKNHDGHQSFRFPRQGATPCTADRHGSPGTCHIRCA